jgi:formamidopyrimidine-DNA glycosylase
VPELPEVETVRLGLERGVVGRTVRDVEVSHPRSVRRDRGGAEGFAALLAGRRVLASCRRGKYLWLPLDSGDALLAHLGMSGQLLVVPADSPDQQHLRVRVRFADADTGTGRELRFVDQRTFGSLTVSPGGATLPAEIAHIAPDPLDDAFDDAAFLARLSRRRTGLKRALLDQSLVSGVGNIYADESLWQARLHYARATDTLPAGDAVRLLAAVRAVLAASLLAGGTSFDALYVSVDGVSGLFERQLAVYGRAGAPCLRCGSAIRREPFMNRSSFRCPRCQPRPRQARW